MPKIKIKNIPYKCLSLRLCAHYKCGECPLYLKKSDHCKDRDGRCLNKIVDLPKGLFPTNREWMESLSNEDLASFYTQGLPIENYSPYPINIHQIIGSFTSSQQGIEEWLSKPCVYLMEEE